MHSTQIQTEVLVVGGGTGGTAAAIQAARAGAKTLLVSKFPWLGGMLTAAGVAAPDGNELIPWQTGLWGAFLRALQAQQPDGLDHGWVSFFTYDPRLGAQIFADWVKALPNLTWIAGKTPQEVWRRGDQILGVRFEEFSVTAQITLDATELGDLLALAAVPHRWGWEFQSQWAEPSAPAIASELTQRYPVQAPTWVVIMQDFGPTGTAPWIPAAPQEQPELFAGAWEGYGPEQFLNYGRLPGNLFMLNWPRQGNDYGEGLDRLVASTAARSEFFQEARWHSQNFARWMQQQLGQRYGLAPGLFPQLPGAIGGGAFALHPYFRESRRLQGLVTIKEPDLLPLPGGRVAPLPLSPTGEVEAIALGNYPNDHHYPSGDIPLKPKSIRWGGRWTGTPFTIPWRSLIPATVDGLLVCEKNISVSHMANGATRLQPVVLGIGQAAGMAAALCVRRNCQPRQLPVRQLQEALLQDAIAPAALIPLWNLTPDHPQWRQWQRYYLEHPEAYPPSGEAPSAPASPQLSSISHGQPPQHFTGEFEQRGAQDYTLAIAPTAATPPKIWTLVTLHPQVEAEFSRLTSGQTLTVRGWANPAAAWLRVQAILPSPALGDRPAP